MRRKTLLLLAFLVASIGSTALAEDTLDDFLDVPQRIADVKTVGLLILSQADPAIGEKNSAEIRKAFWAARPEAGLTKQEADAELAKFDAQWQELARVIRERKVSSISFAGMDLVLLKQAQDWYYATVTPRGPLLIRLSIQYNPNSPVTVHGVQVWTKWEEVKAVSNAMQLKAGKKLFTITYQPKDATDPKPQGDLGKL